VVPDPCLGADVPCDCHDCRQVRRALQGRVVYALGQLAACFLGCAFGWFSPAILWFKFKQHEQRRP